MLTHVPEVLTKAQIAEARRILDAADWIDGNATSGHQSAGAKQNEQLPESSDAARTVGETVLRAIEANPLFVAAALPAKVYPPLFNRYRGGQTFGLHVDNAIRAQPGTDFRIRSDLSCTLFLEEPEAYDGGELIIEDAYGPRSVKLPAGDLVLYPSRSLHRVTPVTRGVRVASFFWLQSLVRDDNARETLFQLDIATQRVSLEMGAQSQAALELTGVYHNLLRRWAEA